MIGRILTERRKNLPAEITGDSSYWKGFIMLDNLANLHGLWRWIGGRQDLGLHYLETRYTAGIQMDLGFLPQFHDNESQLGGLLYRLPSFVAMFGSENCRHRL